MGEVRIGCSGWQYGSWREVVYPKGLAQRRWLEQYATWFDTVEVNATFYRLARPASVAGWIEATPPDFTFAVKASRYLTHMKRLTDLGQGIERFYAGIEPLVGSPKLGPVLWQLPPTFRRDDDRLASALRALPPGQHCFEFRHPSWDAPDVRALLREHGIALVLAHDARPGRFTIEDGVTADWSFLRLHYGGRGRRGNYSEPELVALAERVARLAAAVPREVFVYFNNDWEAFAPRNGRRLRRLLGV